MSAGEDSTQILLLRQPVTTGRPAIAPVIEHRVTGRYPGPRAQEIRKHRSARGGEPPERDIWAHTVDYDEATQLVDLDAVTQVLELDPETRARAVDLRVRRAAATTDASTEVPHLRPPGPVRADDADAQTQVLDLDAHAAAMDARTEVLRPGRTDQTFDPDAQTQVVELGVTGVVPSQRVATDAEVDIDLEAAETVVFLRPGTARPGATRPDTRRPGTQRPDIRRPGPEGPHTGRPGIHEREHPAGDDPVAGLAIEMQDLCAGAVDVLEVAAALEADGVNDAVAKKQYGFEGVFSLAAVLYAMVPRRVRPAEPVANPWHSKASHHLLRGTLFGLPGLCYVTASQLLARPAGVAVVLISLLLSWSASESLSYLGYVRLGHSDRAGAARVLLGGLITLSTVVLGVTVGLGLMLGAGTGPILLGAAQVLYLLGATVVLVCGAERWLLAALAPGVIGSAVNLAVASTSKVPPLVWASAVVTVLATVALAVVLTARQAAGGGRKVNRRDLGSAIPHAVFGLMAGSLLTFPMITALLWHTGSPRAASIAAIPLSLSMGAAEWILYRFRRQTHRLLNEATSIKRFAGRARRTLACSIVGYLVALIALTDTTIWLAHVLSSSAVTTQLFWTCVALGGALFVALALRSCGVTAFVLGACGLALGAEAVTTILGLRLGLHLGGDQLHMLTCAALFGALLTYAVVVLGWATRHR